MGKYIIDGQAFNSIDKAKGHVRNILKTTGICKSVKGKDKQVFDKLKKILSRSHDAVRKGVTDEYGNNLVDDIEIRHNMKGDLEICFTKQDGFTTEDISWVRCINPKEKTHWEKLTSAMRTSIQDQIEQFRQANPYPKCQADPCINDDADYSFEVDHVILFKQLQLDFLKNMPADQIQEFDDCDDTSNRKKFKKEHKEWEDEWKNYHKKYSQLRWLCWPCNRQRKKTVV